MPGAQGFTRVAQREREREGSERTVPVQLHGGVERRHCQQRRMAVMQQAVTRVAQLSHPACTQDTCLLTKRQQVTPVKAIPT